MGLFDKAKKAAQPELVAEPIIEHSVKEEDVWTNLTEKMLRVELDDDRAYLRFAELKVVGDKIRIVSGGIILAEIGKRGKAYKELEPYIGKSADSISLTAKTGDYGDYFRAKLTFKTNTSKISF